VHHPKRLRQAISFRMVNIAGGPAGVVKPTSGRKCRGLRLTTHLAVG
jgi:hypothetical protein